MKIRWWYNEERDGPYDGDPGCLMAIPLGLGFFLLAGLTAWLFTVWGSW